MANVVSKVVMAGVPAFAVVFLCGVCFYAGSALNKTEGKYVTVDKGGVIFTSVMEMTPPTSDPAILKKRVTDPIVGVLAKYAKEGYVVIDTAKDDQGNMSIVALPKETKDITAELSAAIKVKANQ